MPTDTASPATQKQHVYAGILRYYRDYGRPPNRADLLAYLGLPTRSIDSALENLKRDGLICRSAHGKADPFQVAGLHHQIAATVSRFMASRGIE